MDIINHLVAATDQAGLALYAAVMALFLGGVAFARIRDDVISARRARRWRRP